MSIYPYQNQLLAELYTPQKYCFAHTSVCVCGEGWGSAKSFFSSRSTDELGAFPRMDLSSIHPRAAKTD